MRSSLEKMTGRKMLRIPIDWDRLAWIDALSELVDVVDVVDGSGG
jgi:hypothetical protein